MASRKIVIGTAEISANEDASTLAGCSLFCMDNPEGWNFELDSRGAAQLDFEIRVRGDDDDELDDRLEALIDELRVLVGKEIKLVGAGGINQFALPITGTTTFYGRYKIKTDSEGAIVQCTLTADALGDGSEEGDDGTIGVPVWTIHIGAGGLVTAQGEALFSGLDSATQYIADLESGSATIPDWMGTAYKLFDAQIEDRQDGGVVPVHVEMRQRPTDPPKSGNLYDLMRDWEYSLTRMETQPFVDVGGAPVGKPPKLANISGSFQFKSESAPDLISGDNATIPINEIFKAADSALSSLINWMQSTPKVGGTVIEVPGSRKLTPSWPNGQVAFEVVIAILGGPNEPSIIRWQESVTYDISADLRIIKTYRGRRRAAPSAGADVTLTHKFLCESIEPQSYLAPPVFAGRFMFAGGKIPRPAKNQGGTNKGSKDTPTYVTEGETTWIRVSADEQDISPTIPELSSERFPITEENFA